MNNELTFAASTQSIRWGSPAVCIARRNRTTCCRRWVLVDHTGNILNQTEAS
ncbi:MAG: hypothetical protein U1E51_16205 [Candidatus Binatia bacterium]|nr:hypothetical protein [Candidatus Binatia bacterium]